jgi:hypothetical protein
MDSSIEEKGGFMNFGEALESCKIGMKIQRDGWNGKGMFIYYVSEGKYPAKMEVVKGMFENDLVPYGPYLAMKTVQGNVVPWLASQTDILANDWCILLDG